MAVKIPSMAVPGINVYEIYNEAGISAIPPVVKTVDYPDGA